MRLDPATYRVLLEKGMDAGTADRVLIAQGEAGGLVMYAGDDGLPVGALRSLQLEPAKTAPDPATFVLNVSGSRVFDPVRDAVYGCTDNQSGVSGLSIQWGDDLGDFYTAPFDNEVSHTYPVSGTYRIEVQAALEGADTWTERTLFVQWWPIAFWNFTAVSG